MGPNLDESDYETRECGTESRCIQMCDKSADCGAALWKVAADEGCAPEQRKCRHVKMISPNVIDDSNFLHGINVDLYLKGGVRGTYLAHIFLPFLSVFFIFVVICVFQVNKSKVCLFTL